MTNSNPNPTHVQFTVLRARNLISKGKGGNNDVFVTIQLGKEKYQTSTIKNALHPEWFEECDLPIPFLQADIEVSLYHRGVLSDDFLGHATIPIWSNHSTPLGRQSQWVTLRGKPSAKTGSSSSLKNRGELEVKLTFHVKSPTEISPPHGLKKQRPSSIRSFALAFGDKFKFTRSRSFRENRKDPEGGKLDKHFASGGDVTNGADNPSFSQQLPKRDGLTRSYSLSTAYIKSMSLDRQAISNVTNSHNDRTSNTTTTTATTTINSKNSNICRRDIEGSCVVLRSAKGSSGYIPGNQYPETGVNQLHSQSMYNLPGSRQSYGDPPLHRSSSSSTTTAPPPYDPRPTMLSKDDSDLYSIPRHHRRTASDYQISLGYPSLQNSPNPASYPDNNNPAIIRDLPRPSPAVYESIRERTEPENSPSSSSTSTSSDDDPESVPKPKPKSRGKRFGRREVPVMGSSGRDYAKTGGGVGGGGGIVASLTLSPSPTKTLTVGNATTAISSSSTSTSIIQQQQQQQLLQQSMISSASFNTRDSGIVEDRSSSQTNSHDGSSFVTPDGTLTNSVTGILGLAPPPLPPQHTTTTDHHHHHPPPPPPPHRHQQQQQHQINNSVGVGSSKGLNSKHEDTGNITRANSSGSIFYHVSTTRDIQFQGGGGGVVGKETSKKLAATHHSGQLFGRDGGGGGGNGVGGINVPTELVVRKRTRGQRDRLRQMRHDNLFDTLALPLHPDNRRVTVQGLANHHQASSGLYDDSLSDFSDSSRTEVSENLVSAYKNMTKEELLRVAIQTKAQMIRKDQYIKDLENYIDDLLVRVMETTPRLLTRKGQHQHRL